MIAASDTLSPRCGLCLPTAEDWPTVAMPPAAVGRPAACAEGCGRVAYWLVAVPTYRPLGAPVNRQVARLLHLRVPDCGCGAAGDCGTVEHCDLARAWEADRAAERARLGLQRGLQAVGWQLSSAELDLTRSTARFELRRGSVLVTFDARNGKATTTRELVTMRTELRGRRGDRYLAETIHVALLGRTRHEGIRSGLRWLCAYLADNSARAISAREVRRLVAPMLAGGAS